MNLPESNSDRKPRPRSVSDRTSHQCARPGWRPRRGTDKQLAARIANGVRRHRAAGDSHHTEPHEFTPNLKVQAMVQALLDADAQEKKTHRRLIDIRAPKGYHEIMIEQGRFPSLERKYVKRSRARHWQSKGWIIWYPKSTGWTRERPYDADYSRWGQEDAR